MDESELSRQIKEQMDREKEILKRQRADKDRMLIAGLIMIAVWFILYLWRWSK